MYTHICQYCGEKFENTIKNSKFCSNECKFRASSKKIKCNCDNCNKIIYKKRDEYEKNEHHFCSQKCHYEHISFGTEEITCLNCGTKKIVKKSDNVKFCSHKCAMEYIAKEKQEKIMNDNSRKRICKNCGEEFTVYPSETDKYLCSSQCRIEWLKNNVFNTEEHKEKFRKNGRESFYNKYNNMNTNVILFGDYIDSHTKISCGCKIHTNERFDMLPSHITAGQTSCIHCYSSKSYNEITINDFLIQYNYNFIRQKRFKDCRDKACLPFDFYLEDFNIAIEYDGEQHYKPIKRKGMSDEDAIKEFYNIQRRDKIKTDYCLNNNINLIRIPYWEKDNILYYLWDELVKYGAIIED